MDRNHVSAATSNHALGYDMTAFDYLASTTDQRLNQLKEFLRFPSVSAQSDHKADIRDCATWLNRHLNDIGLTSKLEETAGNPVVYAEYHADSDAPTVLYYGHYDVQPPEPLDLWTTPPFEPEIRDGYLYARGATDDKGQTFTHIKGLEAVLKSEGRLPVNVKMLIEGEEEVHSANLPGYLKKNKERLKADIAVISDTAQFDKKRPAITFGLRGIAASEITVYGPNRDLHSGSYGGAIANPITVLAQLVAQLHDKNNKVKIPGFYEHVRPVSRKTRQMYETLPFSERTFLREVGAKGLHGEKGFTTYERKWDRPTCEINGITGGYQGEGAKTIIPSFASCKITMRLVPDQDPDDVNRKLAAYLKSICPPSVKLKVDLWGGASAVVVPNDGPWLDAAAAAIKKGFGKKPVFMKEGGSIPVVADLKNLIGVDTLLLGFGQNDDNIHSPNERFRIVDFENGCRTAAALPDELASVSTR